MTSAAPMSLAPAVAHRPIGPCAKTTTVSPIRTLPDSAPEKPVEAMSASRTTCSSVSAVGDLGQVGLRVRDEQVLGLRAVDRVAEAPAADRLVAAAVTALGRLADEAGVALAARRDRADEDAVADLVADDAGTELVDDADRLVADDEPGLDRVLALQDVDVGAADRRQRDADDRLARARHAGAAPRRPGCRPGAWKTAARMVAVSAAVGRGVGAVAMVMSCLLGGPAIGEWSEIRARGPTSRRSARHGSP